MKRALGIVALLIATSAAAQQRMATDFELAQMEQQLATSRDFLSQLSGYLNLGDLRATRNESSLARAAYEKALTIAERERLDARRDCSLSRYTTATSYAALANAKRGQRDAAFELLEESLRYGADSAKTWNLYATAMSALREPRKAASAASNAVVIAAREVKSSPTPAHRLDLAIYQYSHASALLELGERDEAERLLVEITDALRGRGFAAMRESIARSEKFTVFSSARGDEAAYLSLRNRAQLRLALLYEDRGDPARAREQFERVLADRSDDPTALAGLARIAGGRYFAEAFEANPFSQTLIRDYRAHIAKHDDPINGDTIGARMRRGLQQLQRGQSRAARATFDELLRQFPENDALRALRSEADRASSGTPAFLAVARDEAITPTALELRQLIQLFSDSRLTAEQRAVLDQQTFTSEIQLRDATSRDGRTVGETGTVGKVSFRFPEPTEFTGAFEVTKPLRLTYRILGATKVDGVDALLFEPLRLEAAR